MIEELIVRAGSWGIEPTMIPVLGIAAGILIFVVSVVAAFPGTSVAGRRMLAASAGRAARADFDLVRAGDASPSGLLKAFVPKSASERTRLARQLRQAGIHRPGAMRDFFLMRSLLAIALPAALMVFYFTPLDLLQRVGLERLRVRLDQRLLMQGLLVLSLIGFYGPMLWLRSRIRTRRDTIRMTLPNALDLLQVAMEAGLGFDAAIARIAHELTRVSPAISEEFMMLELEIQAGKERDRALRDMADRIALEEFSSFVNVILQSAQYGSSVSAALATYASEMRVMRELKAQEKANKLPVKMSAVLAALMMPTLLMICLTPVVIKFIRMQQGG